MVEQKDKTYEVRHDTQAHRFEIQLDDEQQAFVLYRFLNNDTAVDFLRTYVPETHREQGLAALLVDAAIEWADDNDYHIQTSCWYAEKRLRRRDK